MKDELKIFIENNKEGFKETPPEDLWKNIESGLKQKNTSTRSVTKSKTKNISTMLKYGFGASVLIVGTFAIINLTKDTSTSSVTKKEETAVVNTTVKSSEVETVNSVPKNSKTPLPVSTSTDHPIQKINTQNTTPNNLSANTKVIPPDTLDVTEWRLVGSAQESYTFSGDYTTGKNIGVLKSTAKNIEGFAGFMLSLPDELNPSNTLPDKYFGKRIRLSGYIKTENVNEWAGLWLRIGKKGGDEALAFDNMRYGKKDRSIKGTTPWTKYEIVLDVPMNASNIIYGVMIAGTGEIRWHTPILEVVDASVPVTADLQTSYPGISKRDKLRSYHPTDFWKWYVPGRKILKDGTSQVNYAD